MSHGANPLRRTICRQYRHGCVHMSTAYPKKLWRSRDGGYPLQSLRGCRGMGGRPPLAACCQPRLHSEAAASGTPRTLVPGRYWRALRRSVSWSRGSFARSPTNVVLSHRARWVIAPLPTCPCPCAPTHRALASLSCLLHVGHLCVRVPPVLLDSTYHLTLRGTP